MSRIRIEYRVPMGVQMYVDGERVERLAEINADESRGNLVVKRDGNMIYVEFEAEIEWSSENGNKSAFLRNIKGIEG